MKRIEARSSKPWGRPPWSPIRAIFPSIQTVSSEAGAQGHSACLSLSFQIKCHRHSFPSLPSLPKVREVFSSKYRGGFPPFSSEWS